MSESRQRITGKWGWASLIVVALVVWFSLFTVSLFMTTWLEESVDPRFLSMEDITWRRMVANMTSKPGLRLLVVLVVTGLSMLFEQRPKRKLVKQRSSFSLEWAMEGKRDGSLLEYGNFVGAV